jgi:hypothetical protein
MLAVSKPSVNRPSIIRDAKKLWRSSQAQTKNNACGNSQNDIVRKQAVIFQPPKRLGRTLTQASITECPGDVNRNGNNYFRSNFCCSHVRLLYLLQ